ncbi:MAG: topoisomerase family protein, partial [Pseudomonadota bacterium]
MVIAEKPSVASDIAKALGGFEKESDYFEGPDMVVGSAVGHLLEIVPPEGVEVKRGKWSFAHLPVIPDAFDLKPLPKSEQRLKLLARLLKRKDVTGVINACDAGREGELIFRLIMQYTKSKLPIQRLWLQSMTAESIREAFRQLRTDEDLQSLANAARCRSEADWLVGINGTRAMTAFNSKDGGFFLTTVGRVQTPSLSILVDREDLIRRFQAKTYFEITASFDTGSEQYVGKWFDPSFSKSDDNADARADRLWERKKAEAVMACLSSGMSAKVSEETKPSSQSAPMLFDLTSLQREANARFGFSAKASLGLTQALYEKHKAVTYPRTDSKALPEDYIETVINCFKGLSKIPDYKPFASQLIAEKRVVPNKKIFNNAKISDHFAIFPTGQIPKSLTEP